MQKEWIEKNLGEGWKFEKLTQIGDLLKLQSSMNDKPYVLVLVFTKGYKKWLGMVAVENWCFKRENDDFLEDYDVALHAYNIQGQMWSFYSSQHGLPR